MKKLDRSCFERGEGGEIKRKYGVLSPPRRTRVFPACPRQKPAGVITPRGGETTVGARV